MNRFIFILIMILAAAFSRLLPHPPNFNAIVAMSLFSTSVLSKKYSWIVPIGAMFLSDSMLQFLIWTNMIPSWIVARAGFHSGMIVVYSTIFLISFFGFLLNSDSSLSKIGIVVFISSTFFFLTTNLMVWLMCDEAFYPHTAEGLFSCYFAAIPFYGWSILGDFFFSLVFFGGLQCYDVLKIEKIS